MLYPIDSECILNLRIVVTDPEGEYQLGKDAINRQRITLSPLTMGTAHADSWSYYSMPSCTVMVRSVVSALIVTLVLTIARLFSVLVFRNIHAFYRKAKGYTTHRFWTVSGSWCIFARGRLHRSSG